MRYIPIIPRSPSDTVNLIRSDGWVDYRNLMYSTYHHDPFPVVVALDHVYVDASYASLLHPTIPLAREGYALLK